MTQSASSDVPNWIANRILSFFNQAQTVSDIIGGKIKDDPSDGQGKTIGPKLAARILRERNKLPFRRFRNFEELDNIKGVGNGTVQDLVHTFGTSAAEAFQSYMYDNNVIFRGNWPLEFYQTNFDDREAFNALVNDEARFRDWVVNRIGELSKEKELSAEARDAMMANAKEAYIDTFHNTTQVPAYAWAVWFYEFDADNWFGWQTIQEATLFYFDYHSGRDWEMELRFFRGFEDLGIVRRGITPADLSVVVNWPEQAITLWFSALYD